MAVLKTPTQLVGSLENTDSKTVERNLSHQILLPAHAVPCSPMRLIANDFCQQVMSTGKAEAGLLWLISCSNIFLYQGQTLTRS